MTTDTQAPIVTSNTGTLAGAREAFQNHEDRLNEVERLILEVRRAFPYLESAFGLPRLPHETFLEETGGPAPAPDVFSQSLDKVNDKMANMEAVMSAILEKLQSGEITAAAIPVNPDGSTAPPALPPSPPPDVPPTPPTADTPPPSAPTSDTPPAAPPTNQPGPPPNWPTPGNIGA